MGQGKSVQKAGRASGIDQAGFNEEEYGALRTALGVSRDVPTARVELPAFLGRFPAHLRPLIQPLFFGLGQAPVGEASASWPVLVMGLSGLMQGGCTWEGLLELWASDQEGKTRLDIPLADLELHIELVASLCFWSAQPGLSPSGADGGSALSAFTAALQMLGRPGVEDQRSAVQRLLTVAPRLPRALVPLLSSALLGKTEVPKVLPALEESRILNPGLCLLLRSMDANLWESEAWRPLYRDWSDGQSFNGVLKGALHYDGPALVLVKTGEGQIIGALSPYWREGNGKFMGGPECILFTLSPRVEVFRSVSHGGNYVYLNSRNKHFPRGLGFGGQLNFFRLWLDADFEECSVLESDATYASGPLLPAKSLQTRFQLSHLEIWGCGGEEAMQAQRKQRQIDEGQREQAKKVDRAKMCESEFDKEMFLGNTFKASGDAREPIERPGDDDAEK